MDLQKIKALIDLAAKSGLSELEYEEDGCRLRLSRDEAASGFRTATATPASVPAPAGGNQVAPAVPDAELLLRAPMFGVFCLTPASNEPPFVHVGDAVRKGQKLCMLEAMKQVHTINADRDGTIAAILAENGQDVDAGQPLFRFE